MIVKDREARKCVLSCFSHDWLFAIPWTVAYQAPLSMGFSRHAGDLRELPRVPLRGEGSCGGGGAPRDSAGSGATEEGLMTGADQAADRC